MSFVATPSAQRQRPSIRHGPPPKGKDDSTLSAPPDAPPPDRDRAASPEGEGPARDARRIERGDDARAPDAASDAPADDSSDGDADEPYVPSPRAVAARRRLLQVVGFAAVAVIGTYFILPAVSHAQRLRLHFGTGSSVLVRATARIGRDRRPNSRDEWERVATWSFDAGAPASIVWSFELPNGTAELEVELSSASAFSQQAMKIELEGGDRDVELAEAMRGVR